MVSSQNHGCGVAAVCTGSSFGAGGAGISSVLGRLPWPEI